VRVEPASPVAGSVYMSKHIALILPVVLLLAACLPVTPVPESTPSPRPAPNRAPTSTVPPTAAPTPAPSISPSATAAGLPRSTVFDPTWDDRTPFQDGLLASEQTALDDSRLAGASVYHLDVRIAGDLTRLNGHEDVRYTNQEDVPLDRLYLRLFPNLLGGASMVTGLTVDGVPVAPAVEFAGSALRVPLDPPLAPGAQIVLALDFAVDVPQTPEGNYGSFDFYKGVLALAHFYPMIAVYDASGWNVEIPPLAGDIVFSDASWYVVRVTAPVTLTVVASGVAVDLPAPAAPEGERTLTFAAGPMRDFYLVASPDFQAQSRMVDGVTVNSYALPADAGGAQAALDFATGALARYDQRFGAYPYRELDLVATPNEALGIEYPGVIAVAERIYAVQDTSGNVPPRAVLESTVAHEVAHQWFYGVVGDDQLDEPWLDESLAQYATLTYYRDTGGEQAAAGFEQSLYARWDRVDRAAIPIGLPVREYEGAAYSAIVYGRGPLFFVALEQRMGSDTFDAFLRDYYATYHYGIATGAGLQRLAETHCACDLAPLFATWVYPQP
jgi:hypothetical protein